MRTQWFALALATLFAAALPHAPAAEASEMVPPLPYKAKEFAILKHDGLYHLFYMRRDDNLPVDGAFVDLGHATSPDLIDWAQHPAVLPVRPDEWDNREIWAPHLIERDGVFYLFYSSVTHAPPANDLHQRIGLATSTDLFDWQRLDEPVFECADVPWCYCDPTTPVGGEFRDPFVIPDPAVPGDYLMYYVARDDVDRTQYLMGAGRSTGDLAQWSSIGSFPNLHRAKTGSYIIESPTLLPHDGLWYLFYTTWNAHQIQFQAGTDPLGGPATWGPAVSIYDETGWGRSDMWFGPETFSSGGRDYIAAVNSDYFWIEFWEIVWEPDGHFTFGDVTVGASEPAAPTAWRLQCSPTTPGWDRLQVSIDAPRATRARVEIRDVAGRTCRQLLSGPLAAGTTRLEWDGNDDRGERARSGMYFVTLQAPEVSMTRKVVRVR